MRWALLLVMACGCRQIFGLDPVATRDAGGDAAYLDARDAQGGTCLERWRKGPQFANPLPLAAVNTATNDRAPFVTADGAQLYYVHDNDFFVATKAGGSQGFGSAMRDDMLASGAADTRIYVSKDKLRAFFASQRPGGSGAFDLWRAARDAEADPWVIDQMYLENLNSAGDQSDPFLSDDLLRMYYVTKDGHHQISYADRGNTLLPFFVGTPVAELVGTQASEDEQPTLTSDELVIVFTSKRSGNGDLYYATRDSIQVPFKPPQILPQVNAQNRTDESPYLTADGCGLYFASDRAGSMDIYSVSLLD